jgi:hypothetical protein
MGKFLQVLSGFVTAPSTTQTALTMGAGDSLQIKGNKDNSPVKLLAAWGDNQTAGYLRVRSTRMHDAAQGIRLYVTASDVENLLPFGVQQRLFQGDTLLVDLSGSATAGDIESASILVYYEDLTGSDARLITFDECQKRAINFVGVENTIALGTAGGYSGSESIAAEYDLLKANVEYALVGYHCSAECLTVGWTSPDWANGRVGGPGNETEKDMTGSWFTDLAHYHNLPLIPVLNGSNKNSTTIDGVQDENGTDVLVVSLFAELAPR